MFLREKAMQTLRKHLRFLPALLLLAFLICSVLPASTAQAAQMTPATPFPGKTNNWTNVRKAPNRGGELVSTYAPNTDVTVYEVVNGEAVSSGNASWYRISANGQPTLYMYSELVTPQNPPVQPPTSPGAQRQGKTTGWANVRTAPNTGAQIVNTYGPDTNLNIYANATGEAVWTGNNVWYRISPTNQTALFVYAGLVRITSGPGSSPGSSSAAGKLIVVSISQQWLWAYENGHEVFNTAVTTGRPELATPPGVYSIFEKKSPTTFYSPWPKGSPNYYEPTHINYAMQFKSGGFYLHDDSGWRGDHGPGTNVWHQDSKFGRMTGTHGCVTMDTSKAAWLYSWSALGTVVRINA
jgi:lipoprotein-anchoring transpeptidase ErfK/SrfK